KFNPVGNQQLYFKYIGGTQDDVPRGLDVDAQGRVYVTGITYSPDFPLYSPQQTSTSISQIQRDFSGFVFRLQPNGDLNYSPFLGGTCSGAYTQNDANSI